ncbi:MAG TPA: alpha/beta fold hydrolase [Steroidobacteraceae bacterium]|jgi:pimeloyl-ACP methyl ester carboxylesterase|nr:alpha/beta fold hydrolase [Steroidobacteraceae bacterium]
MATFVLVHGAWHGSWCWKRVRSALQKLGHEVFTPTLTGVGERSHLLAPGVDLQTHTMDVLNLIEWEQLTDLVLCGHSYGGMVVTGVADRIPERIRALVYLDAFVPEHNQALVQFAPIAADQLIDGWQCKPISAETFGVNLADRAWVDRQCTVQPVACFRQPAQLTGGVAQIERIAYAFASGWAGDQSPFYPFYQQAQSRGWATRKIDCGHDAMLDQPEAVTALLIGSL